MSLDYPKELSNNRFSKNVVQINVNDPDATDLSFVDLPGLIQNADDLLIKTTDLFEYTKLPPVAKGAPSTEIMLRVTAFCQDITDAVLSAKRNHFIQSNHALYSRFKDEIVATTPDFRPYDGDVTWHSSLVTGSHTTPHGLEYVREIIKSCRTWELPRHVPFEATKILVQEYTNMWKNPVLRCFELGVRENTDLLEELLQDHFGQYIFLKKYISYTVGCSEQVYGSCQGLDLRPMGSHLCHCHM